MKSLYEKKTLYIVAGILAASGCIVMAVFPSIALVSAQKGVSLWASSVLPALLPFFICANFMIALDFPQLVGMLFEGPFRKIFGAPGASAFVFTISVISGYPTGAKLIGDMGRKGEISSKEAKRMITFCSTSGPLFMLGAVGAGMLYSPAAGAVIAISHYVGAVLNGVIFRVFSKDSAGGIRKGVHQHHPVSSTVFSHKSWLQRGNLLDIFTDSIISSLKALGIICGYIVLFTMVTDFIQFSGTLNHFESAYVKSLIKGLFEMTVGCSSIAWVTDQEILIKSILCTFLISFGGLSVMAQSMSMLSGLGISIWYYTFTKLCHGILAALAAFLIGPYILSIDIMMTGTFGAYKLTESLGFLHGLLFSTKMVIMVVLLFIGTVLLEIFIRRIYEGIRNHRRI